MAAITRSIPSVRRAARSGRLTRKIVLVVGLALFTIWTVFPLIWIAETSIKPNSEIYGDGTLIPHTITSVHYVSLFQETPFLTYFKNSIFVASLTTLISMVIGILGAYAITRLDFCGRILIARTTIVTYLVPGSLLFIP